ncbi:MAG: DUF4903 domain-containing protein [Dysgonamonadaceae bacterium]|jgi:hypothetical protein|nr:DUF4903 domain-containing protein [Dysgonamonadaceae bacterium]
MQKKLLLAAITIAAFFYLNLSGCKADEETISPRLHAARETLQDSIVFYARAMTGNVNLTQLDSGCPVKYYFSWRDGETMNLQIRNFKVGKMPLISFSIDLKFMELNDWEKDEYAGEGWIKFTGSGGISTVNGAENDGNGIVTGYFNANTKDMEFVTDFNVMTVTLDVYRQPVDFGRMDTYEEDVARYELQVTSYKLQVGFHNL